MQFAYAETYPHILMFLCILDQVDPEIDEGYALMATLQHVNKLTK